MPKSDSNAQKIWNYLVSKFKNQYAAAGIMGNMWRDSKLNPEHYTSNSSNVFCYDDWQRFSYEKFGFGLLNWTWWAAKLSMFNVARYNQIDIKDLDFQLDFLWNDMNCLSYRHVVDELKNATSVEEATNIFFDGYCKENNNWTKYCSVKERIEFAVGYFAKFSRGMNQEECVGKYAKIVGNKAVKLKNSPSFLGKSIGLFCIPGNEYKILAVSKNSEWYYVCHMEKCGWVHGRVCEIFKESGGAEYDGLAVC